MNHPPRHLRERIRPPEELQPIIDAVVAQAWGEGPEPDDMGYLHDWLNGDGWDALLADLGDEMALNIDYLADLKFTDGELRAAVGKEDDEAVTDAERVDYARQLIASIESGDYDDYFYPSVHAYPLTDQRGRHAVLGCTIEIHGQGGAVPIWDGAFVSRDAYLSYLGRHGYWLASQLAGLDDAQILFKWKHKRRSG